MNINNNSCNTLFPRDIVCLRNISINTLHKGDDDDDDNNNNNNNNVLGKPYYRSPVNFRQLTNPPPEIRIVTL